MGGSRANERRREPERARVAYVQARRAAMIGVGVSLGLGALKLAGGWFGHSVALVVDAAHSLGDTFLSGVILAALILAERPPDREHPYGHSRAETVAAAFVAFFLILIALGLGLEVFTSWQRPHPPPELFTLAVAGCGALLQEGLYHYGSGVARRTGSRALLATAWDYRLDALGSLVVLAGVALARWGGPTWHGADEIAALVVASMILWIGCRLFWDSFQELLDRQADPALLESVRREALATAGVLGVETLRVRKSGLEYLVDIHVEVDPEQTVRQSHAIAHAVKAHLLNAVLLVKDVLVHIEPAPDPSGPGENGRTD